ncbi:BirA family biotin operon repressor/biotin-[acetyl-CoA-carboxylase] ligase [Novosphingobium chloroacetimidivorans]|uniref:biotin--[biotin carboxyl-carrier protein] ligase n=1 Tax=Novosphingobium chloroacetimidivorans TaxID=1428314 RepID=A0A7W7NU19_9SPHN|nr:biotin--[acetyl-CoA-carboxylase] ligase [Novosphingobium chloroacetimidivorans]MBB4857093.1 BirA family biotin operon repressor/biotin-[acetyl-CoA-carboxylase] ligase [Novosphingobium chloroacetimidivorans]
MIEVIAETGSTNADLAARVAAGEAMAEGHWLVADRQVAGRGRQGRAWSDGAGNFMGSTAVHLQAGDPPPQTLSLVAGVATYAAVEALAPGLPGLALKWPNDLLVRSAKLAGILLERRGDAVIVGVGVNLVQAPRLPERPTACLTDLGHTVARDGFADMLQTCWAHALRLWRSGGWEQLRADWIARAHPFGTPLKVHGPEGEVLHGTFGGLDPDGALQLQLASGTRRTIHAGEVDLDRR